MTPSLNPTLGIKALGPLFTFFKFFYFAPGVWCFGNGSIFVSIFSVISIIMHNHSNRNSISNIYYFHKYHLS